MKPIQVLLVEDHTIVREGFRNMLDMEADIQVIGEADNGRQGMKLCQSLLPDVVLMDIAMPRLNGLEAARQILKAAPKTKILFLSAHNDDAYIHDAIESGAVGFLLKQSSSHEVCRAIRSVMKGGTYFTASVSRRLDRLQIASDQPNKAASQPQNLTPREREVLQLIAEGKANKETASELGISIKTVEKHREHLMQKLDIHDTAGLTRYAMTTGVIEGGHKRSQD
jgi:DNA-binding NarL/FixJ family response regulator